MENGFYLWDNCEAMAGIIASTIRKLRRKAGLTQGELAAEIGSSTKSITNWETGREVPNRASLDRLAEYFQIGLDDLYNGDAALITAAQRGIARALSEEIDEKESERLYRIIQRLSSDPRRLDLWLRHGEMLLDEIDGQL